MAFPAQGEGQPTTDRVNDLPPRGPGTTPAAANPAAGGSVSDPYISALGNPAANPAAGGALTDPSDPPLLWASPGNGKGRPTGSYNDRVARGIAGNDKSNTLTVSEAERKIFEDDAYRAKVAAQMVAAGLLDPSELNNLGAIQAAWNHVVAQASQFYLAGNGRTPEEVIRLINIQKKAAAAPVPTTTTDNTTQVQNFDTSAPTDIRTALQKMLGRAPTSQEMQSYQAGLNSAAQANPQQQQTVTHDDGKGNVTRNVTQSGGIDPTEVIGQMAQADPEYGAYQASTTYMDALRQAIQAFV